MAVKACPEPALILIPAQQFLGLFLGLLSPTAAVGIFDHTPQGRVGREVSPVIFALPAVAAPSTAANVSQFLFGCSVSRPLRYRARVVRLRRWAKWTWK
jgi:hypothetical protein